MALVRTFLALAVLLSAQDTAFRELIRSAERATPAEAAKLEQKFIAMLKPDAAPSAIDAACRGLSLVGSENAANALAPLLLKPETAEMARYALERITSPKSIAALRAALPKTAGRTQAGIVNTLGKRGDTTAVNSIAHLLASPDKDVAESAAIALGLLGAAKPLLATGPSPAVHDALLRIAARAGDKSIYEKLWQPSNPEPVRIAALRGLHSDTASIAALESGSPALQAAAIELLPPADILKRYDALPPAAQAQAVTRLPDTPSAALTSPHDFVRITALTALARTGNASHVTLLAERAASTTGDEQAAARLSLARIRAVDDAIIHAIPTTDSKVKVELIRALGERGAPNAASALLAAASDTNAAVRREAIRALRDTAGPETAPDLIEQILSTNDDNAREEYARAAASAIRRAKQPSVKEVLAAWESTNDVDVRIALLSVLSAVGVNDALPVVREALKSTDPDLARAAINALADWPSPEPLDDLIGVARTSTNPAQQVLALRGYIKLVQLPVERPAEQTAKLLAAAMQSAKRPEERKAVLAALQRAVCDESLAIARASLADPDVASEAKTAVAALERGLSYRRK
jgi:HEAT repeat protein